MKYPNGEMVRLGDRVRLWFDGNGKAVEGQVVCSLDTKEFTQAYPESEWGYLTQGVLVLSTAAGLIHYTEPERDMELLGRAAS